jgi:hypothetical protein
MEKSLQSHFLNLYSMALSDLQIDTAELEIIYNIGQKKGVEKNAIDEVILNPDKVIFTPPNSLEEKILYLYDFAKIIISDGIINENEKNTLKIFCLKFEFEDENVATIVEFLIESAKNYTQNEEIIKMIKEN